MAGTSYSGQCITKCICNEVPLRVVGANFGPDFLTIIDRPACLQVAMLALVDSNVIYILREVLFRFALKYVFNINHNLCV